MKFYVLANKAEPLRPLSPNDQYIGKWCDAIEVDRKYGPAEVCPLCGSYISMLSWEEPRKMRLTNTRYPDRIIYELLRPVFSERFMNAYLEAGLRGIKSFSKIEVVKVSHMSKKSLPPPNYYLADVGFSQTVTIDMKNTIIKGSKHGQPCPLCNPFGLSFDSIERLAYNTEQWDGTDIFRAYPSKMICSQRFYDLVIDNGFTNFQLVPVDEYNSELE